MSYCRVQTSVRISAAHRIKLAAHIYEFGVTSFWLEGIDEVELVMSSDHPNASRLPAAVAAFNAVMDGEVTPPAIRKPTLQEMHTDPLTHKEPSK
jgi:hypothetical protein